MQKAILRALVSFGLVRKICVNSCLIQYVLSMKLKFESNRVRFSPPPIGWMQQASNPYLSIYLLYDEKVVISNQEF